MSDCWPVADNRPPYGNEAIDAHQHNRERSGQHADARHGVVDAAQNSSEHPAPDERRTDDHRQTEQKQRVCDGQFEYAAEPSQAGLRRVIKSEDVAADLHRAVN